jgi:signal transduction histidine kinase
MMKHLSKLYWRIFAVFLVIILTLGGIYIFIASKTAVSYFEETNQRLNADVAKQIAKIISPFKDHAVNRSKVEKQFKDVMTLNPAAEIYLLNNEGKILAYSAPEEAVKRSAISLAPVQKFIATNGTVFIEGDNPRRADSRKAFSAARVEHDGVQEGYIYIILGGDKYEAATSGLLNSYKLKIAVAGIVFTVLAALIIGLVAFLFITRDINKIIKSVKEFQKGNWNERIQLNSGGDLGSLANTFNTMADTIATNISNIKAMEQSRLELIANVSHDLRTPLSVIQGYAETLVIKKDTLLENEKDRFTQIIIKSAAKLKKLVDELFELSKLEAKSIVPHFEQFSIAELLLDNVLKYRILAEEKDITIHTNIPKDIALVSGDIGLIDRVLQNLIDNALKFTPVKGTVIAGIQRMDGHIEISIADNGIGITPEELPHIFERYSHGDYKESGKGGIGLGLAIISKILELHNTTINVKSRVEEGSIFYFILPIVP